MVLRSVNAPNPCEGWLTKSNKALSSWKKRYCVLTPGGHLNYYASDKQKAKRAAYAPTPV